jgi:hypothetical protein
MRILAPAECMRSLMVLSLDGIRDDFFPDLASRNYAREADGETTT